MHESLRCILMHSFAYMLPYYCSFQRTCIVHVAFCLLVQFLSFIQMYVQTNVIHIVTMTMHRWKVDTNIASKFRQKGKIRWKIIEHKTINSILTSPMRMLMVRMNDGIETEIGKITERLLVKNVSSQTEKKTKKNESNFIQNGTL